jgi:hypothetical protein
MKNMDNLEALRKDPRKTRRIIGNKANKNNKLKLNFYPGNYVVIEAALLNSRGR